LNTTVYILIQIITCPTNFSLLLQYSTI